MAEDNGFQIALGSEAKDKVTEYQGMVIGQIEYHYGCRRYVVQTKELHEGKLVDAYTFDEDALEVLKHDKLVDEADKPWKYELNAKAKDTVTGFEGVITSRTRWLYGGNRYVIHPNLVKDGKPADGHAFDEGQIEILTPPAEKVKMKPTGGPHDRKDAALSRR